MFQRRRGKIRTIRNIRSRNLQEKLLQLPRLGRLRLTKSLSTRERLRLSTRQKQVGLHHQKRPRRTYQRCRQNLQPKNARRQRPLLPRHSTINYFSEWQVGEFQEDCGGG